MKYLKITNNGLLDMRLVHLMGGTTKSEDSFKIGQFGTGLKYSLAYLLRNNIDFKLFIDGNEVKFHTQKETIRDNEFDIIFIDGQKTSITTNMGLSWKGWMIVREIWCNALDEGGEQREVTEEFSQKKGETEFYLQYTGKILETVENWSKYFIHDQKPIEQTTNFAIYKGGKKLRLYKHGVLIKEVDKPSVFSYDLFDAKINELREYNESVDYAIARIIPYMNTKSVEIFLNNLKGTFEDDMDYSWIFTDMKDSWKQAIGQGKFVDYETYDKIVDKYPDLKNQPIVQVPKSLFTKLVDKFPSISLVRASDKVHSFYETYSETLSDKITEGIEILEKAGYYMDENLKIIIGIFGNPNVQGQISIDDKEIRISQEMEHLSLAELIYVLIEENEHFKSGASDETREFQTHLLKLYANILLKDVKSLL